MASKKQIEYLTKLSNWKNTKLPDNVEQLSQAEASALIDKWKAMKSVGNDPVQAQEEAKADKDNKPVQRTVRAYDVYQAGMAKKAVVDYKEPEWIASNPEAYAELVHGVYEAMEEADALLKQYHPGGQKQ